VPVAPRRACLTPGCRSTVPSTTKGGRCELHTKTNTRDYFFAYNHQQRVEHDPRNTQRWKKLRERFLRDHVICQRCGDAFSTECHHVDGQGTDPERCFDEGNLLAVCTRCHHAL
jgi:5-methylcytosine-specific restriction protein A